MPSSSHEQLYQQASAFLSLLPQWQSLITRLGVCRHETTPQRELYEGLIRAVAYQQISTKAGDAILGRLYTAFTASTLGFPTAQQLVLIPDETLRECGFSARKTETIKMIAEGVLNGLIPSNEQAHFYSDEALIARLTTLKGIGRWTVEMSLIYSLERMDIMPLDDFGIRNSLHYLYSPDSVLSKGELKTLTERCAPYRTIAAWYLWRVPQLPGYTKRKLLK